MKNITIRLLVERWRRLSDRLDVNIPVGVSLDVQADLAITRREIADSVRENLQEYIARSLR